MSKIQGSTDLRATFCTNSRGIVRKDTTVFPAKGPCGKKGISEVYVGGSLFSIICRIGTFEAQSKWSNEKLQPK